MIKIGEHYFVGLKDFNYLIDITYKVNSNEVDRYFELSCSAISKGKMTIPSIRKVVAQEGSDGLASEFQIKKYINKIMNHNKLIRIEDISVLVYFKNGYPMYNNIEELSPLIDERINSIYKKGVDGDILPMNELSEEINYKCFYICIDNIASFKKNSEETICIFFNNGEVCLFNMSIDIFFSMYEKALCEFPYLSLQAESDIKKI